jgi:CRISPR-associated protein Cmr4
MKANLYTIKTLTNLHVGSGDINFDIIDNQVQKDRFLPIIHSSSLKGALREHFSKRGDNFINFIFGGEDDDKKEGAISFFESKLLTRPVRSNVKPYFSATTPEIIKGLIETIKTFNINYAKLDELEKFYNKIKNFDKITIFSKDNLDEVYLEDKKVKVEKKSFDIDFFKDIAVYPYKEFIKLELPVIARNKLENGKSVNLWYEEVVPSESLFYVILLQPTNIDNSDKDKVSQFLRSFEQEKNFQIGANKSIGYGFCRFKRISDE